MDLRLSRQKTAELARIVNSLRQFADVDLIKGDISEQVLLSELKRESCSLLLLPTNYYFEWKKIEGFFGLTRTSGPTVAGYHFGQLLNEEIGAPDLLRVILLDFATPPQADVINTIKCLMLDTTRSGLSPLLNSQIYFEDWTQSRGLGNRIDSVMKIPEVIQYEWENRSSSIRVILGALWALIYEEGPGKVERNQSNGNSPKRAYFQVGANSQLLTFRMFYCMPQWTPKNIMTLFWPDPSKRFSSAQMLLDHADFVRVHWIAENQDIEIVVGLHKAEPGATEEKPLGEIRTLWIEPLSAKLISEPPYERPETRGRPLRPLTLESLTAEEEIPENKYKKELEELQIQIKELRKALHSKEDLISELKEGGVGIGAKSSQTTFATNAASALEVFREHFLNHQGDIKATEEKIIRLKELSIDLRRESTIKRLEDQLFALKQLQTKWCETLQTLIDLSTMGSADKNRIYKKVA